MTTTPGTNGTVHKTPDGFEYKQTDEGSEIRLENAKAQRPGTRHAAIRVHPLDNTYEIRAMDYNEDTKTFEPRSTPVLTKDPYEAKAAAIDIIKWELIASITIPHESPLERIRSMKEAFNNVDVPKTADNRRQTMANTPVTTDVNALTSLFRYAKQNPYATHEQLADAVQQPVHILRYWLATGEREPHSSYGLLRAGLSTMGWTPDTENKDPEADRIRAIAAALENAVHTPPNKDIHQ